MGRMLRPPPRAVNGESQIRPERRHFSLDRSRRGDRPGLEELRLGPWTACPEWHGERLDLGWALDVLHPLANPLTPASHGAAP